MKNMLKVALLMLFALVATIAHAQTPPPAGWQFDSVSVGSGQDAVSSGLSGSVWLTNARYHQKFNITVQQEQGWFVYGRRVTMGKLRADIAASVGHFQGVPWVGPYLAVTMPLGTVAGQEVSVSTLQWPFIMGWEPDRWKNDGRENPEATAAAYFGNAQLAIGPVGISYAALNFLDDPWVTLPGVSCTPKLRKDFSVTASITRSVEAKKWLWYVGATWNPGAK